MRLQDKIGLDKCCHFLAGAVIAFAVAYAFGELGGYRPQVLGLVMAGLLGWYKEELDDTVDPMDILATQLGGLVPLVLSWMIWWR